MAFPHRTLICRLSRAGLLSVATLSVASCVASGKALVTDAKPTMGSQFTAALFRKFEDGRASELRTSTFRWEDGAYVSVSGPEDLRRFASMPLQGSDIIIQGSGPKGKLFTYWLGRKLAEGAYLIEPLDETDLAAANKPALCAKHESKGFCFVDTTDNLVTMAEATARSPVKNAEIAVIVRDSLKPSSETLDIQK
jgi:hypothetical protein